MNIDITFPNAPCYMIDLEVGTSISGPQEISRQEIVRRRWDKNGDLIGTADPDMSDPSKAVDYLKDALVEGEQCNI